MEVRIPAGAATGGTISIADREPAPQAEPTDGLRDAGRPAEVTLEGGDLTGEATISFPLDEVEEGRFPIVERLDEATGAWVPEPLDRLEVSAGRISARVDHFSSLRPSWLSVDKLAGKLRELWFAVFGDGLAGGQPPTCPRDAATLAEFDWNSSHDDTLFWCVGTNDDGTVVLNVVNNNRYPIALATSRGMTELGKFGGTWLSAANLGATLDQLGSGQTVLEAREGVTYTLDHGTAGTYELHSDFTLFTWAVGMLGIALESFVDVWTRSGTALETVWQKMAFALSATACYGQLLERILDDPSDFEAARAMLVESFACAGEVFQAAISDYGLLARIAGAVVGFISGTVIGAFEGLVALGELSFDSVRRRATYDLVLRPKPKPKPQPTYPLVCGTVQTATLSGQAKAGVRITRPGVDCAEALRIVKRYFHDDSLPPPEGSSASRDVERWQCYTDTIPTETGAYGGCMLLSDLGASPLIEIT